MTIKVINPYNNEIVTEYPEMTAEEVNTILKDVQEEFNRWKKTSFDHRKQLMNKAAE
ncbi:MAG: aldehyde dehydrogenase family protein, partial [Candidatus Kariarchaeaceae archaeon]